MLPSSDLIYSVEPAPHLQRSLLRRTYQRQVAWSQLGTDKVLTDTTATLVSIDGAQRLLFFSQTSSRSCSGREADTDSGIRNLCVL